MTKAEMAYLIGYSDGYEEGRYIGGDPPEVYKYAEDGETLSNRYLEVLWQLEAADE